MSHARLNLWLGESSILQVRIRRQQDGGEITRRRSSHSGDEEAAPSKRLESVASVWDEALQEASAVVVSRRGCAEPSFGLTQV